MDRLIELGEKMGLAGKDLQTFVAEQQKLERKERAAQREAGRERRGHEYEREGRA